MEPIRKLTVVEQAIDRIHQLILNGGLRNGDRLPSERELSNRLGISRPSLREAIRVLEMMGVIHVAHGNGMILQSSRIVDSVLRPLSFALLLNPATFEELFEVRRVIEAECAGRAAEMASQAMIDLMKQCLASLKANQHNRDLGIKTELTLHQLIAEAAGNAIFVQVLNSISDLLRKSRDVTVPHEGITDGTVRYQELIVAAIENRDSQTARSLMREHIEEVYARVYKKVTPNSMA